MPPPDPKDDRKSLLDVNDEAVRGLETVTDMGRDQSL